ncbi:MAG: ABC transporter ATP-binding protein [Bifidobacteriaceae bacterium]|nr:ABC transporter ATP-binding protein [Bifidobacteriaceae bacterium]
MGGPIAAGVVDRPENFGKTIGKLVRYCKPWKWAIAIAIVLGVVGTVCQVVGPNKLKDMTTEIGKGMPALVNGKLVVGSIDLTTVEHMGFVLVGLYAAFAVFNYLQSWILATVSQRIAKKLRDDVSKKINKLPLSYFDKASYGDVLSRITNDIDAIGQTLGQSLGTFATSVILLFGSIIMMFYNNVIMTLWALAVSIIGMTFMVLIMVVSQKYFIQQQDALGQTNGHVEEMYSGHMIVKAYGAEEQSIKQFETYNQSLFESGWKSQFLSNIMMPWMTFISNLGYVAVCISGAALAMNGEIGFGVIVAFLIYVRLYTQPLAQLAQVFQNMQRCAAASERVFTLLEEPEMTQDVSGTFAQKRMEIAQKEHSSEVARYEELGDRAEGIVDFDHVDFGYTPESLTIKDFDVHISAGQKVAIVGPTGAGKTTMVNLLMRFYELNSGDIKIDEVPTTQIPRSEVHKQFSMVLQDTWVFNGTIRENIVYSTRHVSDEEVMKACEAVGLRQYVESLPQGLDTILDDNTSLSAGQKQLITIARAMIQDAPILILDEATSSVDTRTEEVIQKAMDKLMVGRTSIVIAHRLSTIKDADMILVMNHGEIIERGTHESLLQVPDGFYANLYNSQFASLVA